MLTMVFIMAFSGLAGCAALTAAFEIAAAISRGRPRRRPGTR
jgi:hypothetical protein